MEGGENATAMGWGYTLGTNNNDKLIEAGVPIISREVCTQEGWYNSRLITDGMLCAGYPDGKIDACTGDSGGPLIREVGGAYELTGVISWGSGCAKAHRPGVYSDVYYYSDWISGVAGSPKY